VEPGEVQTRAQAIVDAVDRLERMTGETLDFVRGAEKLVLRKVPLGVLVAELAAGIEQELPGLTVERDFEVPGGRRGSVDVDKIRFSARVAPVAGADGPREQLVLVVADDGPGITPGIRERVFEPFVTHGKKRGTGLGLAVARRFVEDHGGHLELVDGGAEGGRGARFRISLPLDAPAEERPR
jgi:signal transduction histidine kinase